MLSQHNFVVFIIAALSCSQISLAFTHPSLTVTSPKPFHSALLMAGGWGNNQDRSVSDAEFGGVNGSPIYETYEIEDRGQFMQRVNDERKTLRNKKVADLLEVAKIAGVELKRKEKDPEKLDRFDAEDLIGEDDEFLDVSV